MLSDVKCFYIDGSTPGIELAWYTGYVEHNIARSRTRAWRETPDPWSPPATNHLIYHT
jgi:hypothetical protein